MFNLINVRMLSRGAMLLAPIFIAGLVIGNPMWFRVEIVTVSAFIAAERSRLAPLGVLLHALVVGLGFVAMTISTGKPALFVIASVLLAMACVFVTAAGTEMRWTGSFTFIPVLYLACVTANDANGRNLEQLGLLGLETLPYLLCASLPVILDAIISYRAKRCADRSNSHGWFAVRQVSEKPSPGCFEGMIAAALAVGVAASLVEWHHVHYAQWLVWSAASVVTGDVATARAKWKDRMMGAMVGVPAGMLAGILMPHAPLLSDVLTAAIALTLVAFNQYVIAFGMRCALHAVAIIVAGHAIFSADDRAIDVVIGSIIGIVFVLGTNLIMRSLKGPAASSRR